MNEIAIAQQAAPGKRHPGKAKRPTKKSSAAFWGYTLLAVLVGIGWNVRNDQLTHPQDGAGYWLGIAGGSLMLVLLLYPLRKRYRILNILGPTRHWFRTHMIFGLVGPLLILYHCNFQLGSFNSRVAFYCMLLVAGSGIIGRYFYARIHRGLYGRKTSLRELQAELAQSVEDGQQLAKLMPQLIKRLEWHSNKLQGGQVTQSIGMGRCIHWTMTHHYLRFSLLLAARRELKAAAVASERARKDYKRYRRAASRYIREYMKMMGRVAQFSFYERLFALWHVLHLPIFFMMVISGFFHVLAVHMY